MNEMVERVERAIEEWSHGLSQYKYIGSAAIAAMREPTVSMNVAGDEKMEHYLDYDACDVWQAMIDAALAEKETVAK